MPLHQKTRDPDHNLTIKLTNQTDRLLDPPQKMKYYFFASFFFFEKREKTCPKNNFFFEKQDFEQQTRSEGPVCQLKYTTADHFTTLLRFRPSLSNSIQSSSIWTLLTSRNWERVPVLGKLLSSKPVVVCLCFLPVEHRY